MTFSGDIHHHLPTLAFALADRLLGVDESHPGWLQNAADLAVLDQGCCKGAFYTLRRLGGPIEKNGVPKHRRCRDFFKHL
jgi:hypothetical protein